MPAMLGAVWMLFVQLVVANSVRYFAQIRPAAVAPNAADQPATNEGERTLKDLAPTPAAGAPTLASPPTAALLSAAKQQQRKPKLGAGFSRRRVSFESNAGGDSDSDS